jgi:hypothetical protein
MIEKHAPLVATSHDPQPPQTSPKRQPEALETVEDGDEIIASRGDPVGLTINRESEQETEDGSGALLGLELTDIDKAGQNRGTNEVSKSATCYAPLLGTISLKSGSTSPLGGAVQSRPGRRPTLASFIELNRRIRARA